MLAVETSERLVHRALMARVPEALEATLHPYAACAVAEFHLHSMVDDLREAVTTLEDAARIARRVFGGTHPLTSGFESDAQRARGVLRTRETPPMGANCGDTYRVMYSHDTEGVESPRGT